MFIRRRVRQILLRWWDRRITLWARGDSIRIVSIPSDSGILIVSPLFVGLVRLVVVISTVASVLIVLCAAIRVVMLSVGMTAVPLVELVTVLLLLYWGTPVAILAVRIAVL